jgi:hypothetical protein
MKNIIGAVCMIVGAVILIWFGAVEQFRNPDMTEMRILFNNWYWYLIGAVFLFLGKVFWLRK